MKLEETKKIIEGSLQNMGCTEITFTSVKDDLIVATFNCKEITSFVSNVPGWVYSGIHLDKTKNRQYEIDFRKSELIQTK